MKSIQIQVNGCRFYFSYATLVAFEYKGKLVVHENVWSNTTGKHLNSIDGGDKKNRLSAEKFVEELSKIGFDAPSIGEY